MKDLFQPTLSIDHFPHRFCFLLGTALVFALIFCFSPTVAFSANVTLEWNPNTEEDLAGYKIYCGTTGGDYDYTVDVGNQTEYTVTDLEEGLLYYFAATAYDLLGNESDYSNEVAYTPPCGYSITPTSRSSCSTGSAPASIAAMTLAASHIV